ncbi:MAG: MotA/TolQ/ExbB proton channel family protein [Verrucomicrobiaceae bacterium]|nr:MAG: MotA/TolQ/ExbB proton channel family protein [Verrucomicrobiaceae bacterium]
MQESIFQTLAAQSDMLSSVWAYLQRGGLFMIPLGLTSIAGVMAIAYKALALSRSRIVPVPLARDIEQFQQYIVADRAEPVIRRFEKGESALARLAAVVIKHRGKSRAEITHAVESAARVETVHLHAGISVIDTVITIAPLLGLLGTASGLVTIFEGLGDNSDHLAIAKGIAEALTTTIFGLAIAVPCVIAHGFFIRRIEMLTARLEALLADLTAACENPNPTA